MLSVVLSDKGLDGPPEGRILGDVSNSLTANKYFSLFKKCFSVLFTSSNHRREYLIPIASQTRLLLGPGATRTSHRSELVSVPPSNHPQPELKIGTDQIIVQSIATPLLDDTDLIG